MDSGEESRWEEALPAGDAVRCLLDAGTDVAFNALHGPWGEDGTVQGFLATFGLPLTGPNVISAAVCMDKCLTKDVLRGHGLDTPHSARVPREWRHLDVPSWLAATHRDVPLPWIAKPRFLGSSLGIGCFDDADGCLDWVRERMDETGEEYFVEERVRGRELTCAVAVIDGDTRALPPIEIIPRSSEFFDYDAKYRPGASDELCPAPLDPALLDQVKRIALEVHRIFDADPISRSDFMLDERGKLQFLEINTLPGLTATSLVPLAARTEGLSLADLLAGWVEHAAQRSGAQSRSCAT